MPDDPRDDESGEVEPAPVDGAPAPAPSRPRRGRRPSAVPREVVLGLDHTERRVSFVASFVAFALAGLFVPHLLKDTWLTETASPVHGHTCTAPFHWNAAKAICQHLKLTHPSYWVPQFLLILLIGVTIAISAYFRKRVGVAFAGFLVGLALGTVGLPFLLLGGWLLLRALRLQRYGDPSFFGSSRKAREQADARRAARASQRGSAAPAPRRSKRAEPVTPARAAPSASKRYTPKKPARKR